MLLTNLPVADFKTAELIIAWYRARWEIELYFRILKPGCQIEKLRLEAPERLERCIAVSQKPPPLRTMTRMLAQLGGFLARKGDGEPGVETIWRGYMEMMRAVHTLAIARAVGL